MIKKKTKKKVVKKKTIKKKVAKKVVEKTPKLSAKTNTQKKRVLQALEKTLGIVSHACKAVNLDRTTFYEWCKVDPEFKHKVDSIGDIALDMAETSLHEQIKDKIPSSTIFFLKTKGRNRGYIEKLEIDGRVDFRTEKEKMNESKDNSEKAKNLVVYLSLQNDRREFTGSD